MRYQDCLEECIELVGYVKEFKKIYLSYPEPTAKVWKSCIGEAKAIWGEHEIWGLHIIGRYEVKLAQKGIRTVSAIKAEMAVMSIIEQNGIYPELLLAALVNNPCSIFLS